MPDAPLPPLPPADQPRWRAAVADLLARLPAPARGVPRGVVALVATTMLAGLVIGGIALLRPAAPAQVPLPLATPAPAEPSEPAGSEHPGRSGPEEVVVDVAGAVIRPGLVRLRGGSRVADALAAAGGPAADAALVGVNQARVLADGEQVRVPRVGEPLPAPAPPSTAGAPGAGAPREPVDLNRATATELDALPGVGPATATAIVTWRDENGGFRRVDDLLEVPGIGPAKLERLRPHVRV